MTMFAIFAVAISLLISTLPAYPSPHLTTNCPGVIASRLSVGTQGQVEASSVRLRASPGTNSQVLIALPSGTSFTVIGGPECANYSWWEIQLEDGATGWAAEGFGDEYFIGPTSPNSMVVSTPDDEGNSLVDADQDGTESVPSTENLGYSVEDSTNLTTAVFERAVGADDLRVTTRLASLPDTIKRSVASGVESGQIRYDFTLEAFVTAEGYLIRPDAIPLDGNGYIHGSYTPEEALAASEMVLGSTLVINLGDSGEKVSFIFENPVIYGPLTVNPVSLEAIYDFVQRNVEAFSRYSGRTFIISLVSDVDADMLRKMAVNSNVAINMTFGNNFSHSGYSFSQQGSTENLIRIATWSSVQGDRWNSSTFGFTNVMVAIATGMNVEAAGFGRRSNNMALANKDNELLYASLTCSMAGLDTETQSCYESPYELMRNATEGAIPIIPLSG
ncbi:MAG: SH3 domain-containing protein [Anaerolineae bacterium]|nr:SH3 domain-containing protein [Anaerolineae bacterium]